MQSRAENFRTVLLNACRRVYGRNLVTVAVFGSYAREAATPVSDIDLLLVAKKLPAGRLRRVEQFRAIDDATEGARKAIWGGEGPAPEIIPVFKTPEQVEAGSPLFLDMTDWRDILFDRDGFFADYLESLRERMRKTGARRRRAKGGYYWDYKPDFKPGEIVEL